MWNAMRTTFQSIKWRNVAPRIVADFAVIHCAMLVAFGISMAYQTRADDLSSVSNLANTFRHYYLSQFLFLSLLSFKKDINTTMPIKRTIQISLLAILIANHLMD